MSPKARLGAALKATVIVLACAPAHGAVRSSEAAAASPARKAGVATPRTSDKGSAAARRSARRACKHHTRRTNGSAAARRRARRACETRHIRRARRARSIRIAARTAARKDRTAPQTTLLNGPSGTVEGTSATFTFSSNEASSTFECNVDGRGWYGCTTPKQLTGLSAGQHVFGVRARDRAGNIDATPVSRTWTVRLPATSDPTAPTTSPTTADSETPVQPAPAPSTSMLSATFDGTDALFASAGAFWDFPDLGLSQNPDWFAESGTMYRRAGTGWTNSPVFRMWTRRTDLGFTRAEMDVRFNGWAGGTDGWHGINLWLNRKLQTPGPGGRIDDGATEGYVLDFLNRDGNVYIMKKVGDTYHILAKRQWTPARGTWYRWGGRVVDNGNGTSTLQVLVNGQVAQQVTDNGSVGGPRLIGGRVGVRSDYSDVNIDNLTITR